MNNNSTKLSINTDVLEKMTEMAAKEVEGVIGLSKKALDIKGAVKNKNAFKAVKAESVNGAIRLNVYICVSKDARITEVAEKVQQNVKDKVQTMTGVAVTQVNVNVADVQLEQPDNA